jgi:hypothetical protein
MGRATDHPNGSARDLAPRSARQIGLWPKATDRSAAATRQHILGPTETSSRLESMSVISGSADQICSV